MAQTNTTPPGGHAAVYDALMWPFERAALGASRRRLAGFAVLHERSHLLGWIVELEARGPACVASAAVL